MCMGGRVGDLLFAQWVSVRKFVLNQFVVFVLNFACQKCILPDLDKMCVCVCERERERECARANVCVCVCVSECVFPSLTQFCRWSSDWRPALGAVTGFHPKSPFSVNTLFFFFKFCVLSVCCCFFKMIFVFVWKLFAKWHALGAEGYCANVTKKSLSNPMDHCVAVVSVNCHGLGNRQKRKDVFHYYLRNKKYSNDLPRP